MLQSETRVCGAKATSPNLLARVGIVDGLGCELTLGFCLGEISCGKWQRLLQGPAVASSRLQGLCRAIDMRLVKGDLIALASNQVRQRKETPVTGENRPMDPRPIEISRLFPADRARVFAAWSTADAIKRWFSPEACSIAAVELDFRAGGVFSVCMVLPDQTESWARGYFEEVTKPDRLAFMLDVEMAGSVRFSASTVVDFAEESAGTRMTVRQSYRLHDPAFAGAPRGALEGWRSTLNKFARELARRPETARGNAEHGFFTIERWFKAAPARVYHALTDLEAKARWFGGGSDQTILERTMDIRPGGRERVSGRWSSGLVTRFDAVYFDVEPNRRLVYAYEMYLDARKISVSLATFQLEPEDEGCRLIVTEQGVFLDGFDDAGSRERGTGMLLDRLGKSLGAE